MHYTFDYVTGRYLLIDDITGLAIVFGNSINPVPGSAGHGSWFSLPYKSLTTELNALSPVVGFNQGTNTVDFLDAGDWPDYVYRAGFNVDTTGATGARLNTNYHALWLQFEHNYRRSSDHTNWCEWHLNYESVGGVTKRPLNVLFNLATNFVEVSSVADQFIVADGSYNLLDVTTGKAVFANATSDYPLLVNRATTIADETVSSHGNLFVGGNIGVGSFQKTAYNVDVYGNQRWWTAVVGAGGTGTVTVVNGADPVRPNPKTATFTNSQTFATGDVFQAAGGKNFQVVTGGTGTSFSVYGGDNTCAGASFNLCAIEQIKFAQVATHEWALEVSQSAYAIWIGAHTAGNGVLKVDQGNGLITMGASTAKVQFGTTDRLVTDRYGVRHTGGVTYETVKTVSLGAGDNNNVDIGQSAADIIVCSRVRVTCNAGGSTVTGFSAAGGIAINGMRITIENDGTGILTLANSRTSSAGNQMLTGGDVTVGVNCTRDIIYSTTDAKWRVIDTSATFAPFPGVAGLQTNAGTGAGTFSTIGAVVFDPSVTTFSTVYFRAIVYGSVGVTAEIKLYNLTDGENVTGTDQTLASTTPGEVLSAALTVGAAAGNIKTTKKTYLVQLRISVPGSPAVSDSSACLLAQLETH